jgi:hypothetical protein
MLQNKATSGDDAMSVLDCVDEKSFLNLNIVTLIIKLVITKNLIADVAYQQSNPFSVCGDVEWQMKIWPLGVQ